VIDGLHARKALGFPSAGETADAKGTAKKRTKALEKSALNTFVSVWR
jgi:hypothetical protein